MVNPSLHEDLGKEWSWDGETITKADGFLYHLQSSSFLLCVSILLQILHILRELTMMLQMRATDVVYAYKQVRSVVSALKRMRQDSVREFKQVFTQTTKLGQDLHGEQFQLCKPRVT